MLADVPPPVSTPGPAVQVVHHINAVRLAHGRPRVHITKKLTRVAQRQSAEMLRTGLFSHDTSSGMSFAYRVRRLPFAQMGETLAWAPAGSASTPWEIVRGWMGSSEHRRLLMNHRFRRVGVSQMPGRIEGVMGVVTTAEFSTRR